MKQTAKSLASKTVVDNALYLGDKNRKNNFNHLNEVIFLLKSF